MYDYIFLDLDGTMVNTKEGIINSVVYSLNKLGIEVEDTKYLENFIGPPLVESYTKFYNLTMDQAFKAREYYRDYYEPKGLFECEIYPGVEEFLIKLKEMGKKIALCTAKPMDYALTVLKTCGIYDYFDFYGAASMDMSRAYKSQVVEYTIKGMGIEDISKAILIGDRCHDVNGAKANDLTCLGILYGFGDRAELEEAGADYIVDTLEDALKII